MRAPFAAIPFAWLAAAASPAAAQTPQPAPAAQPLTLAAAVDYANQHYPAIVAAAEDVTASAAGVGVARSAYLPRLDAFWQSNRATANNIFGQVLPQPVLPPISGPVLPSASDDSVWSSATGALFTWEPVDFGLRHAGVDGAEAALARARASETLTRLDLQAAVADAFLTLVAAERTAVVAEADRDRRSVLQKAIQTLVDNELRPGADASRADADRAAAETRVIQARAAVVFARIALGRLLGGVTVGPIDATRVVDGALPSEAALESGGGMTHPEIQVREAAVKQAEATEAALAVTFRPRLYFQASVSSRGSGASASGALDGGAGGLALDRVNWAAGLQIVLPNVFDLESLRARQAAAAASTRAETARNIETTLAVTARQQSADALLQSARDVAAAMPVELAAARQTETQARARYDSGLASIAEIADAESVLAQAEAQDAFARVDVWRALLAQSVARGDLAPFLALARQR